jgi:hypothetical protein
MGAKMRGWLTKKTAEYKAELEKIIGGAGLARTEPLASPLEEWKSMLPGFIYHRDADLVEDWLYRFEKPEDRLYGYGRRYKAIALYWMRHGKHRDSGDPLVMQGQKLWDRYVKKYVAMETPWC